MKDKIIVGLTVACIVLLIVVGLLTFKIRTHTINIGSTNVDTLYVCDTVLDILYLPPESAYVVDTMLITVYQHLLDTIILGYQPYVCDTAHFKSGDSLYTTYFYPQSQAYSGYFEYMFFPKPDTFLVVDQTKLIYPRLTLTPSLVYYWQPYSQFGVNLQIKYKSIGIEGSVLYNTHHKDLYYGVGVCKDIHFF